jgi:7-keto-8-aminopelargonate synthetase-like enzyme
MPLTSRFKQSFFVKNCRDIVYLADKYGAIMFVDECHATGFFGNTGRLV